MKLTCSQILAARAGLDGLDGYERVIRDGNRERAVLISYQFGAGLRLALARNKNKLQTDCEVFSAKRNRLVAELSAGGAQVPPERMAEFSTRERELQKQAVEVDVAAISIGELQLDQNPITVSVLALIEPLLVE